MLLPGPPDPRVRPPDSRCLRTVRAACLWRGVDTAPCGVTEAARAPRQKKAGPASKRGRPPSPALWAGCPQSVPGRCTARCAARAAGSPVVFCAGAPGLVLCAACGQSGGPADAVPSAGPGGFGQPVAVDRGRQCCPPLLSVGSVSPAVHAGRLESGGACQPGRFGPQAASPAAARSNQAAFRSASTPDEASLRASRVHSTSTWPLRLSPVTARRSSVKPRR